MLVEREAAASAEVDAAANGQAERVAAERGQVGSAAGAVDRVAAAGELGATEDRVAVRRAAGCTGDGGSLPAGERAAEQLRAAMQRGPQQEVAASDGARRDSKAICRRRR